jgi:PelA/Pel-15E family pectate lyase
LWEHLAGEPGFSLTWSEWGGQAGADYRPIFGDRDKSMPDDVDGISKERRNGYAWYPDAPRRMFEPYTSWEKVFVK